MCALTSEMATSPRWKMPAASAAEQLVASNTSVKCSGHPAPEEAMTGMDTASDTSPTSSWSNPFPWPSSSMQLSRISPAPRASIAVASSYAPMSRPSRPPFTVHCHQQNPSPLGPGADVATHLFLVREGSATYTRRGSMDMTTACAPYLSEICSTDVLPSFTPPLA